MNIGSLLGQVQNDDRVANIRESPSGDILQMTIIMSARRGVRIDHRNVQGRGRQPDAGTPTVLIDVPHMPLDVTQDGLQALRVGLR